MNDGKELLTLTDQSLPMKGVDFSPDGKRLVTAGADGTVKHMGLCTARDGHNEAVWPTHPFGIFAQIKIVNQIPFSFQAVDHD